MSEQNTETTDSTGREASDMSDLLAGTEVRVKRLEMINDRLIDENYMLRKDLLGKAEKLLSVEKKENKLIDKVQRLNVFLFSASAISGVILTLVAIGIFFKLPAS